MGNPKGHQLFEDKLYPLNFKQLEFVKYYYLEGKPAHVAVKLAGYKCKFNSGYHLIAKQMLKSQRIKQYLDKLRGDKDKPTILDENRHLVGDMTAPVNQILYLQPTFDSKVAGLNRIFENNVDSNPMVAVAAVRELNHMQGHYAPTKNINIDFKADPDIAKLMDLSKQRLIEIEQKQQEQDKT